MMTWQIMALAFVALLLFGCTSSQQPPGSTAQEINTIENELSSYDTEFTEIDQILNDPELESIEFVELEESAFQ